MSSRNLGVIVLGCLICFCGCKQEHVTRKDSVNFPIVISSQKDQVCRDDGTLDVHEKGKACILAHWDNNRTYDADGVLVEYNDKSGIWPFYDITSSKTANSKKSSGTILLFFKYDNGKDIDANM